MLRLAGNVLVALAALQAIEFLIAYHRLTGGDWRHKEMGRHVFTFMAAIAVVLTVATVRMAFVSSTVHPGPLWFEVIRLVTFGSIPFVLLWRRVLLSKAQHGPE